MATSLAAGPAWAGADSAESSWDRYPSVSIPRLDEAPTIDGTFDPMEWVGAVKLPPMVKHHEGVLDPDQTEVYVAYTDEAVVFAWRVHRSYEGPMALAQRQPGHVAGRGVWLDDAIELFIDVGRRGDRVVSLAGNAAGAYGDGTYRSGLTDFAPDWNWRYAARPTDQGWEGEVALPFAELGLEGPPQVGDAWGLEVWRNNKTPDASVSAVARSDRAFTRFANIRFAGSSPVFRPLQTGLVGDASMGMMGELVNLTDRDQAVTASYAIYRLRDSAGSLDFFATIDAGLDEPEDTDDVIAFARPEQQIAEVLQFYEPLAEGEQAVQVTAGGRQPINLVAHPAPVGEYVIAVRVEDDNQDVLWSATIPAVRWEPLHVEVTPYFLHELLEVNVSLHGTTLSEEVDQLHVELLQEDRVVTEKKVGRDALDRSLALPSDALQGGTYQVRVAAFNREGEQLSSASSDAHRPTHTPYWIEHDHGTSSFVPEPWTPVEADERAAHVWGREYRFEKAFFPSQIVSQQQSLWTSPPRLVLVVDGVELAWTGRMELAEQDAEYVDYVWTGHVGSIPARARTRIEFDGLITVDLEMDTEGVRVDQFHIEFPFRPEVAELYNFNVSRYGLPRESDVATSGPIRERFSTGFKHAYWVGSATAGLQWAADSNEHWRAQPGRAIEIVPRTDETLLRLRVIDQPYDAPDTVRYRWGLMASPVRPFDQPRNHSGELFYAQLSVPRPFYLGDEEAEKTFARDLAIARELGANWINTFHWVNRYGPPYGPDTFSEPYLENPEHVAGHRRAVQMIHDHGMKTTTYTGWNAMDPKMSDYPYYGEAMKRVPSRFTLGAYKPCMRGGYVDYQANGLAWMIEQMNIEGVYLDGTAGPEPCRNPFHGCGYEHPDTGQRVVTYNLWEHRELFKRMYKILHGEMIDDGMIYGHSGGAPLLMIESFVDIRHGAEGASLEHYRDLEGFMSRYDGRLFGLPFELTWVYEAPQNLVWGIGLLHDTPLKMYSAMFSTARARATDYTRARGIGWRTWIGRRWFDWDADSQWHPYYENQSVLAVDAERAPASFHINDRGQMLLTAVNLIDEPRQVTYTLDRSQLNLPDRLYARDIVTNETFEIHDGRFSLSFLGLRPRLLMIDDEPVAQPQLNMEDF